MHQPALPGGASLQELYRSMADDEYLDEQRGRRRTAKRLLEVVGDRAPGRLLDVGCGHGLLLDEALLDGLRRSGLELSARAVAYARDRLRLPVREVPLEALPSDQDGRWDVVVLADVLEHLEDPAAALERCHRLLAPGGALLLVTPDPASVAARLAGPRWWGYLPAHTVLLPRAILRELVASTGLVIARDVPFVRTFSLRYWLSGLGERSRTLGALTSAARRPPGSAMVSLSLGDERVVVARKVASKDHARRSSAIVAAPGACTSCFPPTEPRRRSRKWPRSFPPGPPTARSSSTTPLRTRQHARRWTRASRSCAIR